MGPYARGFLISRELGERSQPMRLQHLFSQFSEHPLPVGAPKTMVVTRQPWSLSPRAPGPIEIPDSTPDDRQLVWGLWLFF